MAQLSDSRYALLDLKIAQAALLNLRNDAYTEERVWAQSRLVNAARQAGKTDLARAAEAPWSH